MFNRELAIETLLEANHFNGRILLAMEEIINNFLSGREDIALKDFTDLIEGFQWITSVIDLTKPLTNEMGISFPPNGEFLEKLTEMIEAFENRDYVLVGDLLNYEIKPLIEDWQLTFGEILNRINENDAKN